MNERRANLSRELLFVPLLEICFLFEICRLFDICFFVLWDFAQRKDPEFKQ